MNPDNYGSREACQRLSDAGIVLKTDFWWNQDGNGEWRLIPYEHCHRNDGLQVLQVVPAPSMAEVWGVLPEDTILRKTFGETECWIRGKCVAPIPHNTNPTDALIDLLIWVRKEKKGAFLCAGGGVSGGKREES